MDKKWIGAAAGNFKTGRAAGMKPEIIVLHSLNGSLAAGDARFASPGTGLSSHYAVGAAGDVHQYVKEADTAFHAGLVVNPTANLVVGRPKTNPNYYSIGIDHEGKPGAPLTAAQAAASAELIRQVATVWGIPLDTDHVIPHSAIRASADCPGSALDIASLLQTSAAQPALQTPAALAVKTVSKVNLRSRASTASTVVGQIAAGETVPVTGFVQGEAVSGNSFWYTSPDGRFFWAGATDHPNPGASDPVATTDETDHAPADTSTAPAINRDRYKFTRLMSGRPRKNLIILHFTAGQSAQSAFDTWNNATGHVATPYIIDRDGAIYELFDPACWAFHLGIADSGGVHDMRSIGIEIANVGPLKPGADGMTLTWWTGSAYKGPSRALDQPWRGFSHFADFPAAQVNSVAALVAQLCAQFGIPKRLPPAEKQFQCDLGFFGSYTGIATHSNFRMDKWDIGPAFDWPALGI